MLTRARAQELVGQRIQVHAPEGVNEPQSLVHGAVVTVLSISPTQPEVLRTSGGPLQWSRPSLWVSVMS